MSRRASGSRRGKPRRLVPTVWGASAVAAVVLALGVSGTLSAWTSAIITNDSNTVATAAAVILRETSGATNCLSSSGTANSYTCSTINKYGGTTTPLSPGGSQTVDVVFTNVGSAAASSFTLVGGACTQNPVAVAGTSSTPGITNLCTASGELTITLACYAGTAAGTGTALTGLAQGSTAPGTFTQTYTLATGIAAGASVACRFTAALSPGANVTDQGVVVSQPLTWTLVK